MPVTTRSRFQNMFTGPHTPPTDSEETTNAPQFTSRQALSPLERILERLDTLVSRATSSISQPGRNLDYDEGRDGSGGQPGFTQGYSTSPIAGAPVSGQPETGESHSPTRLPMLDTTRPTGSSSLSDLGHPTPTPSSSSMAIRRDQHLQSSPTPIHSNMFRDIRVPLYRDHGPHGRATVPVSNITSTQGHNMLEDLSKADEALRHFSQEGGNPLKDQIPNLFG